MKKLLSIILALTLIAGLIPSVFADNTTTELVYDFTAENDTWSLGVASQSANFKSTPAGLRWTFYLAEAGDKNENENAVVPTFGVEDTVARAATVELKSLKAGTYNVLVNAVKRNSGAVMELHLVKKTSAVEEYMTKENIADYVKTLGSKTRLGKIDICAEESAKFNSFAVSEDGDYYLVMIPIGSNQSFEALYSEAASKYYAFNDISKITFSPVAYPRIFVYNLNSQAFNLSTSEYVSANDSQTAGVLKYNGTNNSNNTTEKRNANGAWVGTKNNTATAAVRNVNSLAYTYIKDGE
ncbi:MAG: hypothetical protein IJB42_02710, partial [Oscillospiraceae bacterium]|nr:hypothetical protein [Oscillospiraceae bacterium]